MQRPGRRDWRSFAATAAALIDGAALHTPPGHGACSRHESSPPGRRRKRRPGRLGDADWSRRSVGAGRPYADLGSGLPGVVSSRPSLTIGKVKTRHGGIPLPARQRLSRKR